MKLVGAIMLLTVTAHSVAIPINTFSTFTGFEISTEVVDNLTQIASTCDFIQKNAIVINDDLDSLKSMCKRNSSLRSCKRSASKKPVSSGNNPSIDSAVSQGACGNFEDLSNLWNRQPAPPIIARHNITGQEILEKRRRKRSTPNVGASPCSTSLVEKVFVFLYSNGTQYELYHNVANHLYQTFYVRDCASSAPVVTGYTCKAEFIKSKAAVFHPITDEIVVRNVFVPATCTYQAD